MGCLNIANPKNLLIAMVAVCILSAPAFGVVTHPSQGDLPISEHPLDSVLGRWDPQNTEYGFASAVAVHPDYVLTTQHQGFASGSTIVQFDLNSDGTLTTDETFNVVSATKHGTADIMICKIENLDGTAANLTNYVSLYQANDEVSQEVVIGGYGKTTGATVTNGYWWTGSTNETLTWGTNIVGYTSTATITGWKTWTTDILSADFDSTISGTDHEAAIAEWDSGGGWFANVDGEWQVAGLNAYVPDNYGKSKYLPSDEIQAIRVSSYVDWIIEDSTVSGDADLDWDVDSDDLTLLMANFGTDSGVTWAMGDFNDDGIVNDSDLNLLLSNFGYGTGGISSYNPGIPEPCTLALLAVGTVGLLKRRRRRL